MLKMRYFATALWVGIGACLTAVPSQAQQTAGALIAVSGTGEVRADNDRAQASFFIEEQDRDKGAAASRVNQKMQQGTALLKQADPGALLATRGYYSYPVYADGSAGTKARSVVGWRVGQYLDLSTDKLAQLPASVAQVQNLLALNGIHFYLSDQVMQSLEARRLEAAYANLIARVRVLASVMGRDAAVASIESLDVDAAPPMHLQQPRMMSAMSVMSKSQPVEETSFEPGETRLSSTLQAKVRFN